MNQDLAKDFVFETCINPASSDINTLAKTIERFGFKVTDYDNLSVDLPGRDPNYMIWLDCNFSIDRAKHTLREWLDSMPVFQWTGQWRFIVRYDGDGTPPRSHLPGLAGTHEFEFDIHRYRDGFMQVKRLDGAVGTLRCLSAMGRKKKPVRGHRVLGVMLDDAFLV